MSPSQGRPNRMGDLRIDPSEMVNVDWDPVTTHQVLDYLAKDARDEKPVRQAAIGMGYALGWRDGRADGRAVVEELIKAVRDVTYLPTLLGFPPIERRQVRDAMERAEQWLHERWASERE